jgi:hypothetical protein
MVAASCSRDISVADGIPIPVITPDSTYAVDSLALGTEIPVIVFASITGSISADDGTAIPETVFVSTKAVMSVADGTANSYNSLGINICCNRNVLLGSTRKGNTCYCASVNIISKFRLLRLQRFLLPFRHQHLAQSLLHLELPKRLLYSHLHNQ